MATAQDPFKAAGLPGPDDVATAVRAIRAGRGQKHPSSFSLENLTPHRDAVFVAGFALVVAGVSMWSVPAALIVAGAGLMYAGYLMSK